MGTEEEPSRSDIWVYDIGDDSQRRLTFEGRNQEPIWTPDGRTLTFGSSRTGFVNLFSVPVDGGGVAQRLFKSDLRQRAGSWSPDGKHLAFMESDPTGIAKIRIFRPGQDTEPQPFLDPDPPGRGLPLGLPLFSPNGRWIAFSGDSDIYVAPFPGPGARIQVSTDGGSFPLWSQDAREIFYRRGRQFLAVPIKTWEPLVFGKASVLFEGPYLSYDVTRDGRFLMVKPSEEELAPPAIRVVLNWSEELRRRVPVN
jgi:dipeptidyl aminopeptidase/acylaminoacyl peptidase